MTVVLPFIFLYMVNGAVIGTAILFTDDDKSSLLVTTLAFFACVFGWPWFLGFGRQKG